MAFNEFAVTLSLSSPKLFSNRLLQRVSANKFYVRFVFLARENITITCAIFHPISDFYFSNYNAVPLRVQTIESMWWESCLDLLTHILIWTMAYWLILSKKSVIINRWGGLVSHYNIHIHKHTPCLPVKTWLSLKPYTHIYLSTHTRLSVSMYIYIHRYTPTHMHTYTHVFSWWLLCSTVIFNCAYSIQFPLLLLPSQINMTSVVLILKRITSLLI